MLATASREIGIIDVIWVRVTSVSPLKHLHVSAPAVLTQYFYDFGTAGKHNSCFENEMVDQSEQSML